MLTGHSLNKEGCQSLMRSHRKWDEQQGTNCIFLAQLLKMVYKGPPRRKWQSTSLPSWDSLLTLLSPSPLYWHDGLLWLWKLWWLQWWLRWWDYDFVLLDSWLLRCLVQRLPCIARLSLSCLALLQLQPTSFGGRLFALHPLPVSHCYTGLILSRAAGFLWPLSGQGWAGAGGNTVPSGRVGRATGSL